MEAANKWYLDRPFLLELFILSNIAFLILDVYVAHSVNDFRHWAEWIPVYFAAAATLALLASLARSARFYEGLARWVGFVVGWGCIVVGIAGLLWHLESQFFQRMTLRNLVYSAPFAAPLSFAGLGFLLLLNRQVPHETLDWGRWVLFLAWGGFVGNFALSLADHAQNGFFYWTEWIAVIVSALAVGFFIVVVLRLRDRMLHLIGFGVLALQAVTGLLGFYFHARADLQGPAESLMDNIIFGAPVFAPLLFADLALLAALGLWDLYAKTETHEPTTVAG